MRPHSHPRARRALAVVGVSAIALALGLSPALASSNGPAPAVAAASATPPVDHAPVATAARATVAVRHDRLNVTTGAHAMVAGTILPRGRGHVVVLQRISRGHWDTVDRAATDHEGQFRLSGPAGPVGSELLRVRVKRDATVLGGERLLGHLNVFRPVFVSWYGPGLYGGALACGGTLEPGTMGVANKTLPCGTKVTLRYHGRSVRVRVIDRGPYVAGREYDLTAATRAALGFGDLGTILATK
jgi:rare lipoprotein A